MATGFVKAVHGSESQDMIYRSVFWQFCDQKKMIEYKQTLLIEVSDLLTRSDGYLLYQLYLEINSHASASLAIGKNFESEISKVMTKELMEEFYLAYISVKIKLMIFFGEKYIDSNKKKLEISLFSDVTAIGNFSKTYNKFLAFMIARFEDAELSESSFDSLFSQLLILKGVISDKTSSKYKVYEWSIIKISQFICKIKNFFKDVEAGTAQTQPSQDNLNYLYSFISKWVLFEDNRLILGAISGDCAGITEKTEIKGYFLNINEFPIKHTRLIETKKRTEDYPIPLSIGESKSRMGKVEHSLIGGTTTSFADQEILRVLIYRYWYSETWNKFISEGSSFKIHYKEGQEIEEEEIAQAYILIHKVYLYMLQYKKLTLPPKDKSIELQVFEFFATTLCWKKDKINDEECSDLLDFVPHELLSRYIVIVLYIFEERLKDNFKSETFETVITNNSELLVTSSSQKFIQIKKPDSVPSKIKITEIVTKKIAVSTTETIKIFIDKKITKIKESYIINKDFYTDLCDSETLKILKNIQKEENLKKLFEYSDALHLHAYFNLLNSCPGNDQTVVAELNKIFLSKFEMLVKSKLLSGKTNFKGFMLYLQHTLLPKSKFSLVEKQTDDTIIKLRFFDLYFMMLEFLEPNSKSITSIRISEKNGFSKAGVLENKTNVIVKYDSTSDLRYGHLWFIKIVDIFNFYGSKREARFLANSLIMNDLTFTPLFDDLYIALLNIRAQINAPVVNAKRFLWNYLMACNTNINNASFFTKPERVFEGAKTFTASTSADDSCVIDKSKLRSVIYLVFAWLKDDASIVDEFIVYEKTLATNKNFSAGLSEVIYFFSAHKSLLSEPFENFCSSAKAKGVLICVAVGMARGIREYVQTGFNDESEFFRHIKTYLASYKETQGETRSVLRVMILETIFALKKHYSQTDYVKAASIEKMLSNTKSESEDWNSLTEFSDKSELAQFYVSLSRTGEPDKEFAVIANDYMKDENFKLGFVYGKERVKDRQLGSVIEFVLRHGSVDSVAKLIKTFNVEESQHLFLYHVSEANHLETTLIKRKSKTLAEFTKIVQKESIARVTSFESTHLNIEGFINLKKAAQSEKKKIGGNALGGLGVTLGQQSEQQGSTAKNDAGNNTPEKKYEAEKNTGIKAPKRKVLI